MSQKFSVLFFGDIVGRAGRAALERGIADFSQNKPDFIIANVENASHGFGLTLKNHDEIMEYGVNCMTSGNHIWDKKDIYQYIDSSPMLIRPYNYHRTAAGTGYRVFDNKVAVINLLGKTFMQPVNCPFQAIEELSHKINFNDKIVIVDYHAEATAEKIAFARYAASYGVNAVIGTHTHVQTADEKLLTDTLAYITDVGFSGAYTSVIGMDYETSLKRLLTSIPERFEVAKSDINQINAVNIIFDKDTNLPLEIKRINYTYNVNPDKEAAENES